MSHDLNQRPSHQRDFWGSPWRARLGLTALAVAFMLLMLWLWRPWLLLPGTQPLVMAGGDPYLRALMRTISASESNVMRPYHVLYGGDYVGTLERHPNRCESIGQGPNRGNCSTAAGRLRSQATSRTRLPSAVHRRASLAAVVVLPAPCRPSRRMGVGQALKSKWARARPRSWVSSRGKLLMAACQKSRSSTKVR